MKAKSQEPRAKTPKPRLPQAICKHCKRPLIRSSSKYWVCSNLDMSHRKLIGRDTVKLARVEGRKRGDKIVKV